MTDVLRHISLAHEFAPRSDVAPNDSTHIAQFYESQVFLLDRVQEFIGTGLRRGDRAIVIATKAHRAGLEARLTADGLDLDEARATGQYLALDAAETLAMFTVDGEPDPKRFQQVVGGLMARMTAGGRWVRAFGEMVALLGAAGNHPAAIKLEQLWNDLQETHPFSLLCAYPMGIFGGEAQAGHLDAVCGEHSGVVPTESYSTLTDTDTRLREVTLLQQKARSLEAEIAERQRAEHALQSLLRISQKLHGCLDMDTLLDQLVEEALQLVGAEGGCAGVRTPQGMACQKYIFRSGMVPLEYCWPRGHGLPGWLLEHKTPYLTNDALADEQIVRELCLQYGVWSALSTPILDAQGEVLGFFELHNKVDGTGFTQADQEKLLAVSQIASVAMQNARLFREAQEAIRLRNELLSVTSHELRTPLTTVAAHAQLMLRRISREQTVDLAAVERAFRAISQQAGKLARLVDQCLDVTRLNAGKLTLDPQPTDLRQLVERVADAAAIRTTQPVMISGPETLTVTVDALRLDQLLSNLVENSLRYGDPEAPIEISLSTDADGTVELSVRDFGPGIPPEKRHGLFERFFQAHSDGYQSGMGLGLFICREIAGLHRGTICAEFPADGGTRMVVRLPAAAPCDARWTQAARRRLAERT